MTNALHKSHPLWLVIALYVMFSGLFYWGYQTQSRLIMDDIQRTAQVSARNAANMITQVLQDQRRTTHAFALDHMKAFAQLAKTPDLTELETHLRDLLKSYLPELFGFNLYDIKAKEFILITDQFRGHIEQVCRQDTQTFAQTTTEPQHLVRVHPNPYQFHYDLYQPIILNQKPYLIFTSFTLKRLQQILKATEVDGHWLVLSMHTDHGELIELTSQGSRDTLAKQGRDNFLSLEELRHTLAALSVPDTRWTVRDIATPRLREHLDQQRLTWLAIWLITSLLFWLLAANILRLYQHQHRLNQQLDTMAHTDPLTGIPNRLAFDEIATKTWALAARNQQPLSIIMADIDYFKRYNDHFGHQKGDTALKAVAQLLRQHFRRGSDLVARYGGEEFIILLPETTPEEACKLAEQVRQAAEALNIENPHVASGHLTLSLGVAGCVPCEQCSLETLIQAADACLYEAKAQGRNRVICQDDCQPPAQTG